MKKLIMAITLLLLIAPRPAYAGSTQIVAPGTEFTLTPSYSSLDVLTLYANSATSVTAAGYDFSPTSATFFLTRETGQHVQSFLWDVAAKDTIKELIDWGNDLEFEGISVYYVADATETGSFQVGADSCSLTIAGGLDGLCEGTSNFVFGSLTCAQIEAQIEAADGGTIVGVGGGTWNITTTGTGDADDLAVITLVHDVTSVTNVHAFPLAGDYAIAGAGWTFAKSAELTVYDNELSTNICVTAGTRKTDTSTLGVAQKATLALDVRRYLNYEIPITGYGGKRIHLENVHVAATFAVGTTNTQIFEGTTQMFPNNAVTTAVVDESTFANGEYIGDVNTPVIIRVDSSATGHISTGWIRIQGYYR